VFDIDLKIYNKNLLFTQAYCGLRLECSNNNNASILRSFNPTYNGRDLFSFKLVDFGIRGGNAVSCFVTKWNLDPLENDRFYNELFDRQLIYKQEKLAHEDLTNNYKGRVLVAEIDLTLLDGASEVESDGLIDGYDWPPIDSWFYRAQGQNSRLLFAWIPEKLVPLVEEGIAVNCIECFYWADEYFDRAGLS